MQISNPKTKNCSECGKILQKGIKVEWDLLNEWKCIVCRKIRHLTYIMSLNLKKCQWCSNNLSTKGNTFMFNDIRLCESCFKTTLGNKYKGDDINE